MAVDEDGPGDVGRLHVTTKDPERATEVVRQGFPGIRLHGDRDGRRFRFDYRRVTDGRLTVHRLRLTGSAEGRGSMTDVVAAGRVRNGRLGLDYGQDSIDTTAPYLRPAGTSVARLQDVDLELIEIEPIAFALAAGRRLEGTGRVLRPPGPTAASPSSPGLVATWRSISDHVAGAALDPEVFANPLIRAGLFDLVTAGVLATFPLTAEVGAPAGQDVQPSAIRRALAYIDDHLLEPIDVVGIAEAARLSPRGLQSAFNRHLGVTPMQHVRSRRLAAAHDELTLADGSDGLTVAMVARRWGFPHLARFAARYRDVYGENPSQTLRQ